MKKIIVALFALCLAFALIGCKSSPPPEPPPPPEAPPSDRLISGGLPESIRQAILNAPEDALVGIGNARLASVSQSRVISTNRARAEIARQMNSMVQDMIRDYQASSEIDPEAALSYQENMTVTLSRADVSGARVVDIFVADDQTVWTVVWMDKTSVAREITQAQSAARLAVPAMASFDAEARMNDAFARMNAADPQVRSVD